KASFLACSFAGMTYVPVDRSLPEERVNKIIEQIHPNLIIGRNISKEQILEIMNNSNYKEIDQIRLKPSDIDYIIFTSGSTGIPKGVKVTYNNLNSCVYWLRKITKLEKGVVLNQANFSFDLSVADLYLSLINGSEHFILNNTSQLDFKKTFEQLEKSKANIMVATPSFLDLLLLDKFFGKELLPNLQTILFCGEQLLKSTIDKINTRFNHIKIINSYGPTECTFAVTSIEVTKNMKTIPVGRAKDDVTIYIVDDNRNELQEGEVGEILIVGKSVSAGYFQLDNGSFIQYHNENAYLTGDLGFIENGILYYQARKDSQIKFKGYRIELADIEKNIQELKDIEKVVAIPKLNQDGKVVNIIAFVMLKENRVRTELEISQDLQRKLPEYMRPKIKIVKEFPINQNGKCDKKRLLEEYENWKRELLK
ncbi:MAG: AMP-binding protein, partial [Clostridia bacterium]|nr:AMP-binding protein [Clostridia bacterium]